MPYYEQYNKPSMKMNPQKLIMDLQISNSCDFYPGTPFPQFMTIEYFRYYKLKLDCGTVATVLSNTDLASYIFSVKSSIIFGNNTSVISLSKNDVTCFRAVSSITVTGDFTAPLGSEFTLMPTACN